MEKFARLFVLTDSLVPFFDAVCYNNRKPPGGAVWLSRFVRQRRNAVVSAETGFARRADNRFVTIAKAEFRFWPDLCYNNRKAIFIFYFAAAL